jgi:hypothetical protein
LEPSQVSFGIPSSVSTSFGTAGTSLTIQKPIYTSLVLYNVPNYQHLGLPPVIPPSIIFKELYNQRYFGIRESAKINSLNKNLPNSYLNIEDSIDSLATLNRPNITQYISWIQRTRLRAKLI